MSRDSWLSNVVFPDPVGPVTTVSSPRRNPLMILVSFGNDLNTVPEYSSGFCPRMQRAQQGLVACEAA